jgi:hypothetical protein
VVLVVLGVLLEQLQQEHFVGQTFAQLETLTLQERLVEPSLGLVLE